MNKEPVKVPAHTPTPWGVSVLDGGYGSDRSKRDGAMIISPPPGDEVVKRLREKRLPITKVRVAMLEASHYTPHETAVANAELIVRAVNSHDDLLDALRGLIGAVERDSAEKGISGYTGARLADARSAVRKAGAP